MPARCTKGWIGERSAARHKNDPREPAEQTVMTTTDDESTWETQTIELKNNRSPSDP